MEKANILEISTEPATSNTASDVQEVENTSDFFKSADTDTANEADENEPENLVTPETPNTTMDEEEGEEEEEEEEEEEGEVETRNVNAIANLVGSAATDSGFARKLYKGLCVMKELIESLEARGVVFEAEEEDSDGGAEEDDEEEEEQEVPVSPLIENAPAVEKVSPLPNAESMIGTNIPLGEEKPANTSESLTPPSTANEPKTVLNTLTGILTGKTPLFSKTRRNKHRRTTTV